MPQNVEKTREMPYSYLSKYIVITENNCDVTEILMNEFVIEMKLVELQLLFQLRVYLFIIQNIQNIIQLLEERARTPPLDPLCFTNGTLITNAILRILSV